MIAALMEFTNYLSKVKETGTITDLDWRKSIDTLLLLLAPTAPHLAEELWIQTEHSYSIHNQSWPRWDKELAKDEITTRIVQVEGKLRDRIPVPVSTTEVEFEQIAAESTRVKPYLEGKQYKTIHVPGRLVNFVAEATKVQR